MLVFTLIIIFFNVALGFIALLHNPRSSSNRNFFFITVAISLLSAVNYFTVTEQAGEILPFVRLVIFSASLHTFLFALFVKNFPGEDLEVGPLNIFLLLSYMVIGGIALSPFGFSEMQSVAGQAVPKTGPLMPVFALGLITHFCIGLYYLIRNYRRSQGQLREQWFYILWGTVVTYSTLIFFNFVMVTVFQNSSFVVYTPLYSLPFVVFTAYAIVKHKLFDIKIIATELLVFGMWFFVLIRILLTGNLESSLTDIGLLFALIFLGVFLVRSVIKEVENRKHIEELAQTLRQANERLKELDQQKSEFLSIASHQFRSPLTAIKGYISLLLDNSYGDISEKMITPIKRILQSSNRLANVVEDFLNVSRIEQGRMKYSFAVEDLKKLAKESVNEMRPVVDEKGIKLSFHAKEGETYPVTMDSSKLKQVTTNLIDNAIKYTPHGSVVVSLLHEGDHTLFRVKDTGIGISKEAMPKLFRQFSRAENARRTNVGGTGLGLYVAKQIVEAHHGRIWAESEGEGSGSTFIVELPAAKVI